MISVCRCPRAGPALVWCRRPSSSLRRPTTSATMLTALQPQPKVGLIEGPSRVSLAVTSKVSEKCYSIASQARPRTLCSKVKLPPRSWDSHMHVLEPQRYPFSADAVYKPSTHTLREALAFESSLGIENIVFVQPSIYGFDNSCLLEALKEVGPSRGRGIVVIDPNNIRLQSLKEWHALGVRGVRVNLKSVEKVLDESQLAETLLQHANAIRTLGWIIQVYLPLNMAPMLEKIVPQLGVRVCIDHYGYPDLSSMSWHSGTFDPYSLPGFSSLITLLRGGRTYVKTSAPYRLTKDKHLQDIQAITLELLRVAPDRVVYATDWPHTRFDNVDIRPFTESCLQWCENKPDLIERLFRLNTEEMLDVKN